MKISEQCLTTIPSSVVAEPTRKQQTGVKKFDTLSPQSNSNQRSYLSTFKTIGKILLGILIFPLGLYWFYQSYFGKESSSIENIPKPTPLPDFTSFFNALPEIRDTRHYNYFRDDLSGRILARQARSQMSDFIKDLGGVFDHTLNGGLPAWTVRNPVDPEIESFVLGRIFLSEKDLNAMRQSLRVSYDAEIVEPEILQEILTKGSNNAAKKAQARGRMISSLATSICNSLGGKHGNLKVTLPLYRIYTSNAPNLHYNDYDKAQFLQADGSLDKGKYRAEITRIFSHFLEEAHINGDQVPVIPGFGLGAFMTPELRLDATECFVNALKSAIQVHGKNFKKIIFADPRENLSDAVGKAIPSVLTSYKSCLDIAHEGAKKAVKIALFNPGDGSGIPGQYWKSGHIALEEMFGLFTTLLIGQHPSSNPRVADAANYQKR